MRAKPRQQLDSRATEIFARLSFIQIIVRSEKCWQKKLEKAMSSEFVGGIFMFAKSVYFGRLTKLSNSTANKNEIEKVNSNI